MNTRILAVDDEEAILRAYNDVLGKSKSAADSIMARRQARQVGAAAHQEEKNSINYEILFARSGAEAVQIVSDQTSRGNDIAVGFFDMKMPGGMDGLETIKRIKQLQPDMLVAVVTAYTDRSVEQIANYFQSQDQWIYFNKPFTHGELKQSALNLVINWNRRRENRRAMRAIRQTVAILKKSRRQAEELVNGLPNETQLQLLERWSKQ